jgi:tetratricopeptide (TPR) repeat protein
MDNKTLHRIFAGLSFLLATVTYLMTVQPTVPFWDCGEFSSAAIWQQVPHPPGAPLFLMLGKVFHVLVPFGDPGWKVNLVAVFSGAMTVLLLYLITVQVLVALRKSQPKDFGEALAYYGSAFIGAAAFTFSDTHWFNSVESEVYATSTLFVALIVWLMMQWHENADNPGHERYIILMAYLIGLSTGVHLLSILTVFSISMVIYFRRYKFDLKTFFLMGIVAVVIFFIIYPFIVKYIPALLAGHSVSRNEAREYNIEDSTFLRLIALAVIVAAGVGLWWGLQKKNHILNIVTTSFLFIILGYTTYTQILLRSNANPPMNENEPKNFSKLASYLGREQYGEAPMWPRRYQSEDRFVQRYLEKNPDGTYVYGDWYAPGRKEVRRSDGEGFLLPEFDRINSAGEFAYMWKYQMGHMYFRYFGWNFVGRNSDVQDAGVAWLNVDRQVETMNYNSGYKEEFPVRFFALPLFVGLVGLFFHFYRDPKVASSYFVLFLMTGVLAALQQNQQDPQPRERDYFYAGSFLVWAIWIGMGTFGLIEYLGNKKIKAAIAAAMIAVMFAIVPVNMAANGWKIHSRAGNYLPFDYSYNILQSVEENAIVFTNGDNDTFPVWWLQDVAGVRRDVRIVNLSLGNTLWYVDQLKNRQPWGAEKIPLTFPDESLQVEDENSPIALQHDFGEPTPLTIPVKPEILAEYTDDENVINSGVFQWTWEGRPHREMEGKMIHLFRIQDKVVRDILEQTRFERPVYYSNTVGPDAYCGLEPFFRYEGMAMRICPVRQQKPGIIEPLNTEVMEKTIMNINNSEEFSKTHKYEFKLRNLNNPDIYYDEVHRRLMMTYRSLYLAYSVNRLEVAQDKEKAAAILDTMNKYISPDQFPMEFDSEFRVAQMYDKAGRPDQAKEFEDRALKSCQVLIDNRNLRPEIKLYEAMGRYRGPYRVAAEIYRERKEYDNAMEVLKELMLLTRELAQQYRASPGESQLLQRAMADISFVLDELAIDKAVHVGGNEAGIQKAEELIRQYSGSQNPVEMQKVQIIRARMNELMREKQADTVAAGVQEEISEN